MSSRRAFITLLGGAAAAWSLAGRAQQALANAPATPSIFQAGRTVPLSDER